MNELIELTGRLNEAGEHERVARERIAEGVRRLELAEQLKAEGRRRGFSIVRAIKAGATSGLVSGYEKEVSEEEARKRGTSHDPHRFFVPFTALRTLAVGTATGAGYVVGTDNWPTVDALFPTSTVLRLGGQLFTGLQGDVTMPSISTSGEAAWVAELGTATSGAPVIGQIVCQPTAAVAYVEFSRQLMVQSAAERVIGNHLLRVIASKIDAAAIAGTGTGEPTGIINATGVDVQDGGTYALATAHAQLEAVATANADDQQVKFLAPPAVRSLLAVREVGTSVPPFVWQNNAVADRPAFVSASMPDDTLLAGDFGQVAVLLWGESARVEIDPYSQFQAAIYGMRVIVDCSVAVLQPGAFSVATSVS